MNKAKHECVDHLGIHYDSIRSMCKAYGINEHTFRYRLLYGSSLKDALTKPLVSRKRTVCVEQERSSSAQNVH